MEYYAADSNYLNSMISNLALSMDSRRRRVNKEISVRQGSTALKVIGYEFYAGQNAAEHRTKAFELVENGTPVLRRGRSFVMSVRFDRPYRNGIDLVRLVFNLGSNPNPSKGTSAVLLVKPKEDDDHYGRSTDNKRWTTNVDDINDSIIILRVFVPVTAPVGNWSCSTFTTTTDVSRSAPLESRFDDYVYILFNPWCKDDPVFMESEDEITEYVLSDVGKIWRGTYKNHEGYRWLYGQFDEIVLPIVMILLEKSELAHYDRWNPIKIARAVAAVTNTQDDEGLIYGRWKDDYSDGISPYLWIGTVAIMEQYLNNRCKSVRYGQCWVFAGAVTTMCRALGIPCRPVTTFCSAHDTNQSLTIDIHYDQRGDKLDDLNVDSWWNFHVWNEVWMSRSDLPLGFGGWQAIDGTPQEISENKYTCGPTSVEAVRKGHVTFAYDSQFVYSEVNADVCYFQLNDMDEFHVVGINKDCVGTLIVTKKIGPLKGSNDNSDREDITYLYKFQDKTEEELALSNAIRSIPSAQLVYDKIPATTNDVTFKLMYIDTVALGAAFQITVTIQNESNTIRSICLSLSADSVRYTGVRIHPIKRSQFKFKLKRKQVERVSLSIEPKEYLNKLSSDHSLIKMYAIANVAETKQTWLDDDDFFISKPKLDIQVIGTPSVDGVFEVVFSFRNILPVILTNCSFNVQMSGVEERPQISTFRNVYPEEIVKFECTFSPNNAGQKTIVGAFTSNQLTDVVGSKSVLVI